MKKNKFKHNNDEADKLVAEELVKLIRTIVKDEIAKIDCFEKYKDGVVVSSGTDSCVVSLNGEEYEFPNNSSSPLKAKDKVRVFHGDKLMTDAYIGTKL